MIGKIWILVTLINPEGRNEEYQMLMPTNWETVAECQADVDKTRWPDLYTLNGVRLEVNAKCSEWDKLP